VEYLFAPGGLSADPGRWAALRLVFERVDRQWKLVGVIHDEWTI
jgi:hypothetical protein